MQQSGIMEAGLMRLEKPESQLEDGDGLYNQRGDGTRDLVVLGGQLAKSHGKLGKPCP